MARFLYGKPLMLAHRCLYPEYPENTIPSLLKVIKENVDYIEIDCEFTKDYVLIVSHDSEIDRCTDGHGKVNDLNFDELRQYNAANYVNNPDFGFVPIPTVEEIFQTILPSNIRAELHIHDLNVIDYETHTDQNIPDLLVQYNLEPRCNINIDMLAPSEFVYAESKYEKCRFSLNAFIEESLSSEQRMNRLETILEGLNQAKFIGLDLKPYIITQEVSDKVHDYGMELQCYPTNDPEEMERLMLCECDVIQTDRLDLLKNIRENLGF
jgi:glycerophosphoryl diester phosphodiesterase